MLPKIAILPVVMLVGLALSAGCSQDSPRPSQYAGVSAPPHTVTPNYMPLKEGNKWTYRRITRSNAFTWSLTKEQMGDFQASYMNRGVGQREAVPGAESEEIYEIVSASTADGIDRFIVSISPPSGRDGRYAAGKSITWSRQTGDLRFQGEFREEIVQSSIRARDGQAVHEALFLIVPRSADKELSADLVSQNVSIRVTLDSLAESVIVPAGSFDNCIQVLTTVLPSEGDTAFQKGWTTLSMYAPDVGLVKEVQRDYADAETYSLELTSFELK